jgi:hypothetical protein
MKSFDIIDKLTKCNLMKQSIHIKYFEVTNLQDAIWLMSHIFTRCSLTIESIYIKYSDTIEFFTDYFIGPQFFISWFKELNPRRRVYVEIPKPARVELKCSQNQRC